MAKNSKKSQESPFLKLFFRIHREDGSVRSISQIMHEVTKGLFLTSEEVLGTSGSPEFPNEFKLITRGAGWFDGKLLRPMRPRIRKERRIAVAA
jgi:hypothetical protein